MGEASFFFCCFFLNMNQMRAAEAVNTSDRLDQVLSPFPLLNLKLSCFKGDGEDSDSH